MSTGGATRQTGAAEDHFRWTDRLAVEGHISRFDPDQLAEAQRGSDPSDFAYLTMTFTY